MKKDAIQTTEAPITALESWLRTNLHHDRELIQPDARADGATDLDILMALLFGELSALHARALRSHIRQSPVLLADYADISGLSLDDALTALNVADIDALIPNPEDHRVG